MNTMLPPKRFVDHIEVSVETRDRPTKIRNLDRYDLIYEMLACKEQIDKSSESYQNLEMYFGAMLCRIQDKFPEVSEWINSDPVEIKELDKKYPTIN